MSKKFKDDVMRVSFDLDEVLFVPEKTHKIEPPLPFPLNKIFKETLRKGTAKLIPALRALGFEVWVYTSSFRSEKYIRTLFRLYGIKFDGIVNGTRHMNEVQGKRSERLPNKLPNRYHISLHIDDESIVAINGRDYGFNVYELNAQDDDWEEKIIKRVYEIKHKEGF